MTFKNYSLLFALFLLSLPLYGQRKVEAGEAVLHQAIPQSRFNQEGLADHSYKPLTTATNRPQTNVAHKPYLNASNKGQVTVTPVPLGTASNAYTSIRVQQNQVAVDLDNDVVAFIHRQNVNIWGGGGTQNGMYRYDLSVDGGQTFTTDIGPLQTQNTQYGRYPNAIIVNPSQSNNPFDTYLNWYGPTTNSGWVGHIYGTTQLSTTGSSSTENYDHAASPTLIPGSLTEGEPGEYWLAELQYDGSNYLDSLYLYKGIWSNSGTEVEYQREHTYFIPWDKNYDSNPHTTSPVISFSPDGQIGWMAMLGDLDDQHSIEGYSPIVMKSTDGGDSWSAPIEYDLNNISWIADSLQTLWTDSAGNPASSGIASTAFELDITVDANNNPHIICVVGTAPGQYRFTSSLAKFAIDFHSTDGGSTWDASYLAPILTFRGEFGQPDINGDLLPLDNYVQISRDAGGDHIFYSWVDTDTCIGNFGANVNSDPDVFISARRISDNYRTGYKGVTSGDLVWGGFALFPTLAPTVIHDGGNQSWKMPIVIQRLEANDQLQPVSFHYFGNDAVIEQLDFQDPNILNLAWGNSFPIGGCDIVSRPEPQDHFITEATVYPIPSTGLTRLAFYLEDASTALIQLIDLEGKEVARLAEQQFPAGENELTFDVTPLSAGIYTLRMETPEEVRHQKFIVHNR